MTAQNTQTYPGNKTTDESIETTYGKVTSRAFSIFNTRDISATGDMDRVNEIKIKAADLWDRFDQVIMNQTVNEASRRYIALAKTDLESAVQWAVKAVSRVQD